MPIRGEEAIIRELDEINVNDYTKRRILEVLSMRKEFRPCMNCGLVARYVFGYSDVLVLDSLEKRREFMNFSENFLSLPNTQILRAPEAGCLTVFGGDLNNEHFAIYLGYMKGSFSMHGIGGEFGIDHTLEIYALYNHVNLNKETFIKNLNPLN